MEVIEEPTVQGLVENVKVSSMDEVDSALLSETIFSPTSNGVAESAAPVETSDAVYSISSSVTAVEGYPDENVSMEQAEEPAAAAADCVDTAALPATLPNEEILAMETDAAVEQLLGDSKVDQIIEKDLENSEAILCNEITIEGLPAEASSVETCPEKVTLRTEILVEKGENDDITVDSQMVTDDHENENILSELGQGIEFSEALRSSDMTDNGENNNDAVGEEVFNKEELLDILEGNDDGPTDVADMDPATAKKLLESEIAMKQLKRLKSMKHVTSKGGRLSKTPLKQEPVESKVRTPRKKRGAKTLNSSETAAKDNSNIEEEAEREPEGNSSNDDKKSTDSIVNVLVKDWDDDEPPEESQAGKVLNEASQLLKSTDEVLKTQDAVTGQEQAPKSSSTETPTDGQNQNKSGDESQPQRRLGRVIKKKVIFDPDNPDTFTKGKALAKNKETHSDKEQPPPKKVKPELSPQRAASKSPTSKLQWKKPTPKNNSKQKNRLSEVDKLLMDEGAVNMIYQLTPEAPKGRKNMRTKAEFIKKIQSSTPEGKEMKFRERKSKGEEGEAKKILGGKSRSSLSSSVKSPSVSEDFETHSADDSIIYRRHSSSSYSSACMSPRRLSDVETGARAAAEPAAAGPAEPSAAHKAPKEEKQEPNDNNPDVFMADAADTATEVINLNDCLSIKEKLNSKLSLVLNKKKKESPPKPLKPQKQKRMSKASVYGFKHVYINVVERLAEICIRKTTSANSVEVLKELEQALLLVDGKPDVSVTFLTSECGTLCSDIVLKPLLGDNMEIRINYAHTIAEAVRSLVCTLEKHSKLVVSGAWGACSSVALAVLALSDVALASEDSTFALSSPPMPGVAALTMRCSRVSQTLVNDLIVFGRRVSAAEARGGGLLSRVLPGRAELQRAVAAALAREPAQSVVLKKQLLNLKKSSETETTFRNGLEKERDLLVEYWTSMEGQEVLRSALSS